MAPQEHRPTKRTIAAFTATLTATLATLFVLLPLAATAQTVVGYVVSVEAEAYAQAPGQAARRLECDAPIYRDDLITTLEDPGLAILSTDTYVRLAGNSSMRFGTLSDGAPDLELKTGHVRMLDTNTNTDTDTNTNTGSRSGRIATPGLLLADARSNSEAIVFAEKVWTISMICSPDDALGVERTGNPGERRVSAPGQCTIGKPNEPLYTAVAGHAPLELLARAQCGPVDVRLGLAGHFAPGDLVALLPAVGAGPPGLPSPAAPAMATTLLGCTVAGSCQENLQFVPSVPVAIPTGPPAGP